MHLVFILLSLVLAPVAAAFDFVSTTDTTVMYDANSLKAKKLYVATPFLPLEQVVVLDNWVKVRDHKGHLSWVEKRLLSSKRYVVVTAEKTAIRSAPDESASMVFEGTQHLGLEWLSNAEGGWVQVRHQGGETGYVRARDVWGE